MRDNEEEKSWWSDYGFDLHTSVKAHGNTARLYRWFNVFKVLFLLPQSVTKANKWINYRKKREKLTFHAHKVSADNREMRHDDNNALNAQISHPDNWLIHLMLYKFAARHFTLPRNEFHYTFRFYNESHGIVYAHFLVSISSIQLASQCHHYLHNSSSQPISISFPM